MEVVETLERHARTLGDEYVRDWMHLRSGEQWDARLLSLVEQADVFQLFWSRNSAGSPFVEREWRHALRLGREAFVRPTYWELPMPPPPPDLAGIHFHRLTPAAPLSDARTPSAAPPMRLGAPSAPALRPSPSGTVGSAPAHPGAPAGSATSALPAAPVLRSPPTIKKETVRIEVPPMAPAPVIPKATVKIVPAPVPMAASAAARTPAPRRGASCLGLLLLAILVAAAGCLLLFQHG